MSRAAQVPLKAQNLGRSKQCTDTQGHDSPGQRLTPHLARLLPNGCWERRWTRGTFTLPMHMAFFSGFLPKPPAPRQPTRLWECRPPAIKDVDKRTFVFNAPDLLHGLEAHGYRTVCVGGVTYFPRETPLANLLPDLFDEDHWRPISALPSRTPQSTRSTRPSQLPSSTPGAALSVRQRERNSRPTRPLPQPEHRHRVLPTGRSRLRGRAPRPPD